MHDNCDILDEDALDEDIVFGGMLDTDPTAIPEIDKMDYLGMAQDLVRLMLHKDLPPMELADNYCEAL